MPPTKLGDLSSSMKLKHAKLGYQYLVNNFLTIMLISLLIGALRLGPSRILVIWNTIHFDTVQILCSSFLVIFILTLYYMSKPQKVYLVDFACNKPPAECCFSFASFNEHSKILFCSEPRSHSFQLKVLERAGLGDETCCPPAIHLIPPDSTMKYSWEEAEMTIFSVMDSLFQKTRLDPTDIDILVVNCSIFTSTPSLSAMVINKYKMKESIKSFNILGMGCSASLISISIVRDLLQAHPNYNAVVVSADIITANYYTGKERSMLLPNCLFRMGAAAMFLSARKSFRNIRAKYCLHHLVRTQTAVDDKSYKCVYQKEDSEGIRGVWLSKELLAVAGEAMKLNMTTLGPLVLPASERLIFLVNLIARKFFKAKWRPYIPDFKQAFEHFCVHAGGRAVIDGVQNSLKLSTEQVEASRAALHRFGNTSSSTLWYELAYIEAKGRMRKGDRIWQLTFGSGYKCNSAVWKCSETVKTPLDGPWLDCIDNYPARLT